MKNNLIPIATLTLVCMTAVPVSAQFGRLFGGPKIETVETDELNKMLSQQHQAVLKAKDSGTEAPEANFVLVDVRSNKEVKVSVIPGAITKQQYEEDPAKYRGKLVIAYCTVGGRSGNYARELAGKDVKVKNYEGSILKWVGAGLPLITLDGQPTKRVHTYSDRYKIPAQYEQIAD
ncbi:molybdopterin biosynthesis protein MoeB [Rubripirellula lacrimiformis]|uniref:Molybdopterin biosynthesis protein MoeB n=1 Tax=Rubripirellula lacrimiformis TaxID=1930273 RepID=A0A517NCL7_9BACT|nr:rhodanese-like domain-containing protein [Rubripirellula lacrimiformis]QDT04798.1 molybdopterin biosynthesis protein MoeB [Rubripirellula lacrimiformis]